MRLDISYARFCLCLKVTSIAMSIKINLNFLLIKYYYVIYHIVDETWNWLLVLCTFNLLHRLICRIGLLYVFAK